MVAAVERIYSPAISRGAPVRAAVNGSRELNCCRSFAANNGRTIKKDSAILCTRMLCLSLARSPCKWSFLLYTRIMSIIFAADEYENGGFIAHLFLRRVGTGRGGEVRI